MTALTVEILNNWEKAIPIRDEWNALCLQVGLPHPFSCYEYLDCWYRAYSRPEEARIILIREGGRLKAIFPGVIIKEKFKGIPVSSFSYAANWYSSRADLIVAPEDKETFLTVFKTIQSQLPETFHLIKLWMIQTGTPLAKMVNDSSFPHLFPYNANQIKSPGFDLSNGWESYFQSRSKKIRYRFRQAEKRANNLGSLAFDIFSTSEDLAASLPRLKSLDAKTWQYKNGSGLFSTLENETFNRGLLEDYSRAVKIVLAFVKIGDRDAAYEMGVIHERRAFFLKYGYDPEFSECRPGVLVQSYLARQVASWGVQDIDLGMLESEEKGHWQTKSPEFNNYWLIRKDTFRGRALVLGIRINNFLRKHKKLKEETKSPEKEESPDE